MTTTTPTHKPISPSITSWGADNPSAPNTPWGRAQSARDYAPGANDGSLVFYETASHGGFRATGVFERVIRQCFPNFKCWADPGWYEEDCDQIAVVLAMPERFDAGAVEIALRLGNSSHMQTHKDWGNYMLTQSHARAVEIAQKWIDANAQNYRVGSRWYGSNGSGCIAKNIGTGDAFQVSVPGEADDRYHSMTLHSVIRADDMAELDRAGYVSADKNT